MNVRIYLIVSAFPVLLEGRRENHRGKKQGQETSAKLFLFMPVQRRQAADRSVALRHGINIAWEFVSNVNSQAPPQDY